jgi:hypothetical protein
MPFCERIATARPIAEVASTTGDVVPFPGLVRRPESGYLPRLVLVKYGAKLRHKFPRRDSCRLARRRGAEPHSSTEEVTFSLIVKDAMGFSTQRRLFLF